MWKVPADHEIFGRINSTQWLWYFHNYERDKEEHVLLNRDFIEYHAGFLAPEMVEHVRKNRTEDGPREGVIGTTDEQAFADSVGSIFGRDPGFAGPTEAGELNDVSANVVDRMAEYEQLQAEARNTPKYNYRHWADFDLE